jgi:hypothetical protein
MKKSILLSFALAVMPLKTEAHGYHYRPQPQVFYVPESYSETQLMRAGCGNRGSNRNGEQLYECPPHAIGNLRYNGYTYDGDGFPCFPNGKWQYLQGVGTFEYFKCGPY